MHLSSPHQGQIGGVSGKNQKGKGTLVADLRLDEIALWQII